MTNGEGEGEEEGDASREHGLRNEVKGDGRRTRISECSIGLGLGLGQMTTGVLGQACCMPSEETANSGDAMGDLVVIVMGDVSSSMTILTCRGWLTCKLEERASAQRD
ncbi:hypothetical protein GSI_09276 [Ganoderma sinense ZZ0214-1]|uniref:Uncharacterized protein n=1 Tax=Ganoderma sinense ZZ0214-1 TaxID=1077348 RepID=A0A2G8S660_9APHY|nr:hypothetical protein GSI_09276 [Ganoderma sinense ZZ0214-1]